MTKNSLVSVLVPTYNREAYIHDCIQSALSQSYPHIEVVVVDNCSTDRTLEICNDLAGRDSRVRVFQNSENIGPVRNWKKCAEYAQGEYIKVLFSDDMLLPTCIEELVKAIQLQANIGIAYCAALIGPQQSTALCYYRARESAVLSSGEYIHRMLVARAPYSPCATLMRRESFLLNLHTTFNTAQLHYFDRHGAGPDCMVQLLTAHQYGLVAHVNKPLVYFRSHEGSFTAENLDNQVHRAYLASLAYFAKNYLSKSELMGFLFLTWLDSVRRGGWISPLKYYREREARGTVTEFFASGFSAVPLLRNRMRRNAELRAANPTLKI